MTEEYPLLTKKMSLYLDVDLTKHRICEMNTVNMPGFTAEASLDRTSRYHQMAQEPSGGGAIRPASFLDRRCYTRCRTTCRCGGLTGGNLGACLRECNADCLQVCTVG